jgi:hypothetical protein
MKLNPEMEHHDPNATRVAPKKTDEIVWNFNELCVGQVLLKNKRIHSIDDHVVASVYHEGRLGNAPEIVERVGTYFSKYLLFSTL